MTVESEFDQRFSELLSEGQQLLTRVPRYEGKPHYWIPEDQIAKYQRWIGSVINLVRLVDQPNGTFMSECERLLEDKDNRSGIAHRTVQKMHGLLLRCWLLSILELSS